MVAWAAAGFVDSECDCVLQWTAMSFQGAGRDWRNEKIRILSI